MSGGSRKILVLIPSLFPGTLELELCRVRFAAGSTCLSVAVIICADEEGGCEGDDRQGESQMLE